MPNALFSLKGKSALVTGGAGYFGGVFSEAVLRAEGRLILFSRGEKGRDLAEKLTGRYGAGRVQQYDVDLSNDEQYRHCLREACERNKTIDVLVNNAFEFSKATGFNDPSGKIEAISKTMWMRGLEAGIYWYAAAIQLVGEKMKQQRRGSIINVSSMYAVVSPDPQLYNGTSIVNPPSYSAAKAAVLALTRYTASFYGMYNIRCNALVPGAFPNQDPCAYNAPSNSEFLRRLTERTVLGRCGRVEDLVGALIFLASDASAYVTGQDIIVDGGWTIR